MNLAKNSHYERYSSVTVDVSRVATSIAYKT